jgi:hypothetical protein
LKAFKEFKMASLICRIPCSMGVQYVLGIR